MADVNDTHGARKEYNRAIKRVKEAAEGEEQKITRKDKDAILAFKDARKADNKSINTIISDLSTLRNAAERAPTPLLAMSKSEKDDFIGQLGDPKAQGGYGLKEGGIYNYKRAFKVFFRYLDNLENYAEFEWWEEINPQAPSFDGAPPKDERLYPEEVTELKRNTGGGQHPLRDRALIGFLAEGHRISASAELRVGDVDPYGLEPEWVPNKEALNLKDLEIELRPLLWCAPDIRRWLNEGHPDPENDDAPLWTGRNYDPNNPQDCALGNDGVRSMLERTKERAEIDKPVNPHNFRHAAVTRLRHGEDLEDSQIISLLGWADERMLERYDDRDVQERNRDIRSSLGFETPDDDETMELPTPEPCWNCNRELAGDEKFCPGCGEAQSIKARMAQSNAREDVEEGLEEDAGDPAKTVARSKVLQALNDPEVVAAITEQIEK